MEHILILQLVKKKKKGNAIPVTGREGPQSFERIVSQKAVRLSALRAGRQEVSRYSISVRG
jgi:hypothetical protein